MEAATVWGIILVVYAVVVIAIAIAKLGVIWRMSKIQAFVKILGEKGTAIFFLIFALVVMGIGIALIL